METLLEGTVVEFFKTDQDNKSHLQGVLKPKAG